MYNRYIYMYNRSIYMYNRSIYICTNIKIRTLEFEARFRSDPSVFQPFPTQPAFQPSLHRLKLN